MPTAEIFGRSQRGQATVELALCLPLLAFLVAVLVEVGGLAADHVRVWHSAREAARVAVVDPDHDAITEAATRSGLGSVEVEVEPAPQDRVQGDPLTVRITYDRRSSVPLVGKLFDGIVMTARATMRIEQP